VNPQARRKGARLRWRIVSRKLEALYRGRKARQRWAAGIAEAFARVMGVIDAMPDVRDLYALKSLHFERLSGDRKGQSSVRLNKQYRLIVTVEREDGTDVLVIHEIVDYHR
jgi:toxin HigB-1